MGASLRVLAASLLLAACMVGTSGRGYAPAKGPAGAMVSLELQDRSKVTGELLAVEEATLLVLEQRELVRVSVRQIKSGKAPKISFSAWDLPADKRERLRLVSRYPQGVSSELEARLLQAYGGTAVRQIS